MALHPLSRLRTRRTQGPTTSQFVLLATLAVALSSPAFAQDGVELGFPVSKFAPWKTQHDVLAIGGHNVAVLSVAVLSTEQLQVRLDWHFNDVRISDAAVLPAVPGLVADEGLLLVSGTMNGNEGYLGLFRIADRSAVWENKALPAPITVICTSGSKCIAGNDAGLVTQYDLRTGQAGWSNQLHSKLVTAMVRISDTQLASADWVGKIVLLDAATGREITNFQQHRDRITALIADPASSPTKLYSSSLDGTVRLWYPAQRRLVRFALLNKAVVAIASMGNNRILATTSDARIHVVDLNAAKVLHEEQSLHEYIQAMWPISDQAAIASDGRLRIFRVGVPTTKPLD